MDFVYQLLPRLMKIRTNYNALKSMNRAFLNLDM